MRMGWRASRREGIAHACLSSIGISRHRYVVDERHDWCHGQQSQAEVQSNGVKILRKQQQQQQRLKDNGWERYIWTPISSSASGLFDSSLSSSSSSVALRYLVNLFSVPSFPSVCSFLCLLIPPWVIFILLDPPPLLPLLFSITSLFYCSIFASWSISSSAYSATASLLLFFGQCALGMTVRCTLHLKLHTSSLHFTLSNILVES